MISVASATNIITAPGKKSFQKIHIQKIFNQKSSSEEKNWLFHTQKQKICVQKSAAQKNYRW